MWPRGRRHRVHGFCVLFFFLIIEKKEKKKKKGGELMGGRILELCFCLWRWWEKGVSCPFCTPSSLGIGEGDAEGAHQ